MVQLGLVLLCLLAFQTELQNFLWFSLVYKFDGVVTCYETIRINITIMLIISDLHMYYSFLI